MSRWFIYKTVDQGTTLKLVGEATARTSREALDRFVADPPPQTGTFTAISAGNRRLRNVKSEMRATITEVEDSPLEETQEPLPQEPLAVP
jgi:hypothetical protein